MALGSCQFSSLQEPKGQSQTESLIMQTLAKVSLSAISGKHIHGRLPWWLPPMACVSSPHVPGDGTGRGSVVLAVYPRGTMETFGRGGIWAKGGCVWPGEMGPGKGRKRGSLFQVRKMLVM